MDKNIRVAFWHNSFAPYRVPVFQALSRYDDIDLTVYYGTSKDRHRRWQVDFGSGYHHILLPSLSVPGYPHRFNYSLVCELLKKRYDVYIASENEIGCQLTYLAARLSGKPFIVWSEDIDYQIVRDRREYTPVSLLKKIPPFLGRKLQRIVFFPLLYGAVHTKRHADACLAAGRKTEAHLTALGARGPFFRHGSTVDTKDFQRRLREQKGSALAQHLKIEGKTVVLSVSYLQKRKGIQYLIEAFIRFNHPDAVLVIVGDGEYKPELFKLLPEDRTDILFVGHDENTARYYAIADIFVMPSFSDPWGLTVNEAMLAGLPVITTSNVGAQELIQGNGYVIPPRDSAALETVLNQLLHDADLRRKMGRRSQEIIKHYTIVHSAEACHNAILSVHHAGETPPAT